MGKLQPADLPSADDKIAALALTPVSRETEARLDRYVDLLVEWQAKTNLVAPSTLPHLWTRHIADSLQLLDLAPTAKIWVESMVPLEYITVFPSALHEPKLLRVSSFVRRWSPVPSALIT